MSPLLLLFGVVGCSEPDPDAHVVAVEEPRILATAAVRRREVRLTYAHASKPGALVDTFGERAHEADYWPRRLGWIDGCVLCLGGLDPETGNTILEAWFFDLPRLVDSPRAPSGREVRPANRTAVLRLFDAHAPGRDGIQGIMPLLGSPTPVVLVQFGDSRDVFAVDVHTGAMSLAASPSSSGAPSGAPLIEPRLAEDWSGFQAAGAHRTLGFVYVLRRTGLCDLGPGDGEASLLLLFDHDRDGVLDGSGGVSEWEMGGMSRSGAWE